MDTNRIHVPKIRAVGIQRLIALALLNLTMTRATAASPPTIEQFAQHFTALFQQIETAGFWVSYRWEQAKDSPRFGEGSISHEFKLGIMPGGKRFGYSKALSRQPNGDLSYQEDTSAFDGAVCNQLTGRMGYVYAKSDGVYWRDSYLPDLGMAFTIEDRQKAQSDPNDLRWLPHAFNKRTYTVSAVTEMIAGEPCWRVECPEDKIWFASHKGFALVRRDLFAGSSNRLRMRITHGDFVEVVPGAFLPRRTRRESYDPTRSGNQALTYVGERRINELTLGKPLPESLFHIEFPIGTLVNNLIEQQRYLVTPAGKSAFAEGEPLPTFPRHAIPWWWSTTGLVILTNTVIIIGGAILIYLRRRRD